MHDLGHEDTLLELLRLFHIQGDDLTGTLLAHPSAEEAPHHQRTDDQHHEDPRNISHTDAETKEEKHTGDTEGREKEDIEAGELDQQQRKCSQQCLSTLAAEAFHENDEQEHAQCSQTYDGYVVEPR